MFNPKNKPQSSSSPKKEAPSRKNNGKDSQTPEADRGNNLKKEENVNLFEEHIREEKKEGD